MRVRMLRVVVVWHVAHGPGGVEGRQRVEGGRGQEGRRGERRRWGRRTREVDAFKDGLTHLLHTRHQLLL